MLSNHNVFADMIELMVEGQHFDMMVLLASDNRTIAAAGFNLTSTTLYRGATVAGRYSNRRVFLESVYDGVGEYLRCRIDFKNPKGLEDHLSPFPSACNTATSGDTIVVHLKNHRLYLGLSEESLTGWTKRYEPQPSHITWGYLRHNANHVIPASEGVPMPIDGLQAG